VNRHISAKTIALLLLAAILLVAPMVTKEPYVVHILIMAGISIILCTSLRLVVVTGVWNLGQSAFYAIGAYTLTLLMVYCGVSFWLLLPLSGIAAAVVSLGLGYVTIRVRGMYFAMLTLAFVEIITLTITAVPFLGAQRVMNIPPPNPIVIPHLLRVEFTSKVPYYYLVLALVIIILTILYMIERSRTGSILKSISAGESLCESIGIDITRYRVTAFVICSFFAGVAGGLYAPYVGLISPGSFNTSASIMIFLSLVVGGLGSFWGPVVGAVLLTTLPEVLRGAATYEPMVYTAILILIIFFLPGGLTSLPAVVRHRFKDEEGGEQEGH
jgi:branched-chain amino acid transport system permease protein